MTHEAWEPSFYAALKLESSIMLVNHPGLKATPPFQGGESMRIITFDTPPTSLSLCRGGVLLRPNTQRFVILNNKDLI